MKQQAYTNYFITILVYINLGMEIYLFCASYNFLSDVFLQLPVVCVITVNIMVDKSFYFYAVIASSIPKLECLA